MRIFFICLIIEMCLFPDYTISGQERSDSATGYLQPVLGYIADGGRNFKGGIKTGNAYMGLAYAGVLIQTDRIWSGGEFAFEMMNSHGHCLSGNYIGDIEVVSNIENGNYTFLYQLLFKQRFHKGYFIVGLQDINAEFAVSDLGAALTNSSFGMHSTIALNVPVSAYPKNALGIMGYYKLSDNFFLRTGLFDSDAGSLDNDPYNTDWSVQGLMSISEIEFHTENRLHQIVKLGAYYLTGDFPHPSDTLKSSTGNYGFYLITDQKLIDREIRGLGIFGQFGFAPHDRNCNTLYTGLGLNLNGPFKKRPNDILAAGIALAQLFDHKYECDIEINYNFNANNYISIQPAFHFVINPGANQHLNNAIVGFLRISVGM